MVDIKPVMPAADAGRPARDEGKSRAVWSFLAQAIAAVRLSRYRKRMDYAV